MQEKPSNPGDRGPLHEPSSTGGPEDFLGLGESYDATTEPARTEPTVEAGLAPDTSPDPTGLDLSWAGEEAEEEAPSEESWDDPEWDAGEEDDGSTSWLMELDIEDEQLIAAQSEDEPEAPRPPSDGEEVSERRGRKWLGLVAIVTVSVVAGVAASKFLPGMESHLSGLKKYLPWTGSGTGSPGVPPAAGAPQPERVASAPAEPAPATPGETAPVALGPLPPTPRVQIPLRADGSAETAEPEPVAVSEPARPDQPEPAARPPLSRDPFRTLAGPRAGSELDFLTPFAVATRSDGNATLSRLPTPEPTITNEPGAAPAIETPSGALTVDSGRESRTQVVKVEDMVLLPEEISDRVREASASELAGMWMGATIPVDAIDKKGRLLTPAVGRVRVLLGSGEIFEGILYAVGQRKVWLDTELGKMALLSWQVHRIEHILDAEGVATLGESGSHDLAGLERVRVRTPGGVFYGKVIDHADDAVTLVTAEGARITLRDAVVDPAGLSATRLIDARGAVEPPESAKQDPE